MRVGVPGCAILVVAGPGGVFLNGCGTPSVAEGTSALPSSNTIVGLGLSRGLDGMRTLSVSESGFAPGTPGVLVGAVSGRVAHRHDNFSASAR